MQLGTSQAYNPQTDTGNKVTLPDGTYLLKVSKAEEKTSKAGSQMLMVTFKTQNTLNAQGQPKEYTVNYFLVFGNEHTQVNIDRLLVKGFGLAPGQALDSTQLINQMVVAKVSTKGEFTNVGYFEPARQLPPVRVVTAGAAPAPRPAGQVMQAPAPAQVAQPMMQQAAPQQAMQYPQAPQPQMAQPAPAAPQGMPGVMMPGVIR